MPRYIPITFLFLGWIFYELSEGAHAPQETMAEDQNAKTAQAPSTTLQAERLENAQIGETVSGTNHGESDARPGFSVENNPESSAVQEANQSLYLGTGLQDTKLSSLPATRPSEVPSQAVSLPRIMRNEATTIMSPQGPGSSALVRSTPVLPADIRRVVTTRANLRTGPGLSHDIVARLSRGQRVEVLGNDGQGWLRLRALPEGDIGWIVERLISPAES